MRRALILLLLLTSCTHATQPVYGTPSACRTPMPLELRMKRMQARLDQAYAHAPPLSAEEHKEMTRFAACAGAAVLGVGDGCARQYEAARTSGLQQRNLLRGAAFIVPEYVTRAVALPLGAERTHNLLTGVLVAEFAWHELEREVGRAHPDDPLQMMLVGADLQQAIVCDAADQARGKTRGSPFDPAAAIPEGP